MLKYNVDNFFCEYRVSVLYSVSQAGYIQTQMTLIIYPQVKTVRKTMKVLKNYLTLYGDYIYLGDLSDSSLIRRSICLSCVILNNIWNFSSYLTGNTLILRYEDQPVTAMWGNKLFIMRTVRNTQVHSIIFTFTYIFFWVI
jgi:hypothetical protein